MATPWCNDSVVTRGGPRTRTRCSCGVCCGVQPRGVTPRVVIRGRPAPCAELACCGRPRPRVVIVVPTRGSALSSSHYRGANRVPTTGLKPELQLHSPPNRGVLSSVACAWFGLLPKGCRSRVRSQCRTLTSHVRHRAPRVASRIALCTRPPTTHSRGASGHTSWI